MNQYEWLREQGFDVVEYKEVNAGNVEDAVKYFAEAIK